MSKAIREYWKSFIGEQRKKNGKLSPICQKGEKNPNWKGGSISWKKRNHISLTENQREQKRKEDRLYVKGRRKEVRKIRRKKDPKFRLDNNMASIISTVLKGEKAGRKWQDLVGYTIENLMKHLEKQFNNKMNWDNYGSYWWIDHIKPKSLFKYKTAKDPEFKKCWALENLQPLEKITNIKKGNKF